jgi:hypothetical protein
VTVLKDCSTTTGFKISVFTPVIRGLWAVTVAVTIISEIVPIPPMPPMPFYIYKAVKVLLFVIVGYLAPLAFWRFNALNRGILLAAASAMFVESLQGILGNGHSFHWYELAIKLALILLGFNFALDARYERKISLGPIQIGLIGEHLGR